MSFDLCTHHLKQLTLKAGAAIRKEKGLPEEPDVTRLYKWTVGFLGITYLETSSAEADHLPAPHEMMSFKAEENSVKKEFIVPRKDCSLCGAKESVILISLCPSCKDSEGGKYHSAWKCMTKDCTHIDKSDKFMIQVLREMGIEFESGNKQSMGIKTLTDEGLK